MSASLERAQLLGTYGGAKSGSGTAEGSYALSETSLLMSEKSSIHSAISQVRSGMCQATLLLAQLLCRSVEVLWCLDHS